jgi:hypothetical protein
LNAGATRQFSHRNSQEISAALAVLKDLRAQIVPTETGPPEGLAPQPELQQLFPIVRNSGVAGYLNHLRVHEGTSVIKGKPAGREQAVVKECGAGPVAANHKDW